MAIAPRFAHPADYAMLAQLAETSPWELPDDDAVHALGTDPVSRTILAGGFLYPCQAILANSSKPDLFIARSCPDPDSAARDCGPLLIVDGCGVLVNRTLQAAELALLSGLAQVIQRIDGRAPLRYLTEAEAVEATDLLAYHYRELANTR